MKTITLTDEGGTTLTIELIDADGPVSNENVAKASFTFSPAAKAALQEQLAA